MAENEAPRAGFVSDEQALQLLLLDIPGELQKLITGGWIKRAGPNRWVLVSLIQGFARYSKWRASVSSTAELAACWGITKQRIQQLVADGWFKPIAGQRGFY